MNFDELRSTSNTDQAVTAFVSLGDMMSAYYNSLIRNGVPYELAYDMTRDYAWAWACSQHNVHPDQRPN